ncbi:MAG TPA: lipid-A-disaccharide synthase N-terminal domain-containing protein [Ohtaekwangia sp.]|nr:lipid-A-disaccharide synthase N-terminal domain-containing protein [Ohtaekwangia sp.]
MHSYWLYALGFFAQGLFGTRLLVQLFHSERQGKVVSPAIFWQLSLVASFLFLIYGLLREDFVIILGQTLSYFIYIRNLQLKNQWTKIPLPFRSLLMTLPLIAFAWIAFRSPEKITELFTKTDLTDPIIILGSIGQLLLNIRFIYQWWYSEKRGTSVLPLGFWIISAVASVMILRYAWYTTPFKTIDPVLLVAQSMGMIAYLRNIYIHSRARVNTAG